MGEKQDQPPEGSSATPASKSTRYPRDPERVLLRFRESCDTLSRQSAQKSMPFLELNNVATRETFPGFKVHFVHSANMTFAHWKIEAGALLPQHSHPHEQVVNMIEGQFELTIDGATKLLGPDSVAIIPSHAVHSGRAVTPCWIIDAFYPIREDYR